MAVVCLCCCVASKVKAIVHPLLSCAALTLAALALYAQVLGQTLTQQLHVSPSAVDHRQHPIGAAMVLSEACIVWCVCSPM